MDDDDSTVSPQQQQQQEASQSVVDLLTTSAAAGDDDAPISREDLLHNFSRRVLQLTSGGRGGGGEDGSKPAKPVKKPTKSGTKSAKAGASAAAAASAFNFSSEDAIKCHATLVAMMLQQGSSNAATANDDKNDNNNNNNNNNNSNNSPLFNHRWLEAVRTIITSGSLKLAERKAFCANSQLVDAFVACARRLGLLVTTATTSSQLSPTAYSTWLQALSAVVSGTKDAPKCFAVVPEVICAITACANDIVNQYKQATAAAAAAANTTKKSSSPTSNNIDLIEQNLISLLSIMSTLLTSQSTSVTTAVINQSLLQQQQQVFPLAALARIAAENDDAVHLWCSTVANIAADNTARDSAAAAPLGLSSVEVRDALVLLGPQCISSKAAERWCVAVSNILFKNEAVKTSLYSTPEIRNAFAAVAKSAAGPEAVEAWCRALSKLVAQNDAVKPLYFGNADIVRGALLGFATRRVVSSEDSARWWSTVVTNLLGYAANPVAAQKALTFEDFFKVALVTVGRFAKSDEAAEWWCKALIRLVQKSESFFPSQFSSWDAMMSGCASPSSATSSAAMFAEPTQDLPLAKQQELRRQQQELQKQLKQTATTISSWLVTDELCVTLVSVGRSITSQETSRYWAKLVEILSSIEEGNGLIPLASAAQDLRAIFISHAKKITNDATCKFWTAGFRHLISGPSSDNHIKTFCKDEVRVALAMVSEKITSNDPADSWLNIAHTILLHREGQRTFSTSEDFCKAMCRISPLVRTSGMYSTWISCLENLMQFSDASRCVYIKPAIRDVLMRQSSHVDRDYVVGSWVKIIRMIAVYKGGQQTEKLLGFPHIVDTFYSFLRPTTRPDTLAVWAETLMIILDHCPEARSTFLQKSEAEKFVDAFKRKIEYASGSDASILWWLKMTTFFINNSRDTDRAKTTFTEPAFFKPLIAVPMTNSITEGETAAVWFLLIVSLTSFSADARIAILSTKQGAAAVQKLSQLAQVRSTLEQSKLTEAAKEVLSKYAQQELEAKERGETAPGVEENSHLKQEAEAEEREARMQAQQTRQGEQEEGAAAAAGGKERKNHNHQKKRGGGFGYDESCSDLDEEDNNSETDDDDDDRHVGDESSEFA